MKYFTYTCINFSLSFSLVAFAGPVPDTAQTQSYTDTFGEDSDYSINPQSYTKLDDQGNDLTDTATSWAMVRDNVTGLIWEVKTDDGSIHDKDNEYFWYGTPSLGGFIKELNDNNFGGFSDWRLPTVKELSLIVNSGRSNPAINVDYFLNMVMTRFWSSTACGSTGYVWIVIFDTGIVHNGQDRYSCAHMLAVRGGESAFGDFLINGDGTVTDTSTALMWQQATAGPMTWEEALTYCETLSLGGYDEWRLPNRNELQSIVDYSAYRPAIDTSAFPDTVSSCSTYYWSSTTSAGNPGKAWYVGFVGHDSGQVLWHGDKSNSYCVRAVRGGG